MSWTTVIFSASGGACFALAVIHLLVWVRARDSWVNLFFAVAALSAAACAIIELNMMHARTPEAYGELVRWIYVPMVTIIVAIVCFIRLYLQAGRVWLACLIIGLRVLVSAVNFWVWPNASFQVISGLHTISFWGESISFPIGVPSPWRYLTELSTVLLLWYVLDAAIVSWRQGNHRQSLTLCGAVFFSVLLAAAFAHLMALGILPIPFVTVAFMFIALSLFIELSADSIRSRQLFFRDFNLNRERMSLAARAANLGLWEWDLVKNEIWANEASRARVGARASERITPERFFESVHPEDREAVRQTLDRVLEHGGEFRSEYRIVSSGREERWVEMSGLVERGLDNKPLRVRGVSMDITERRLAENALRRSEQIARVLLNTPSAMTHLIDVDGTIIDLNDTMANALGGTREELIGTNVFDRFPGDSAERRQEILRRVAREHKLVRFEDGIVDGNNKVLDTFVYPVETLPGGEQQFVIFVHDITERKMLEESVRESAEKFRNLMEQSPDPIVIWNPDGTVSDFNQAWIDLWRISSESLPEVLNKYNILEDGTFGECGMLPDLRKVFSGESKSLILPPLLYDASRAAEDADISPPAGHAKCWVQPRFYPVKDPSGTVSYVVGLQENISDRKEAELFLEKSEAHLRRAQEIANSGSWELDLVGGELIWSDEVYRIFGADRKTPLSYEGFLNFILSEDQACVDRSWKAALHGAPYDIEHRILVGNTVKWVREKAEIEFDETGQAIRGVGIVQDITDRKRAEQQLLDYQRHLKALASQLTLTEEKTRQKIAADLHDNIGHSLALARIQLGGIPDSTSALETSILVKDISAILLKALQDTRQLIFDLGSRSLEDFGLGGAITEWLEERIGQPHRLKTEFVNSLKGSCEEKMDYDIKVLLLRSIQELLTNVVKHARASLVRVRLSCDGDCLHLAVEDDGIGFATPKPGRDRMSDVGFGLFSIRTRMTDMGGSFNIESQPGKGCRAVLTLPLPGCGRNV